MLLLCLWNILVSFDDGGSTYQAVVVRKGVSFLTFGERLSFFLHLDVFLSFLKFAAIPRISAYGFPRMDFRGWSFLLFSGLRFPHEVRPRQLLCWRRPRWFSTSFDLWLFSLSFSSSRMLRRPTKRRLSRELYALAYTHKKHPSFFQIN